MATDTETTPDPRSEHFFDRLARSARFDDLADPANLSRMPQDWVVGVADIVNSTAEIEAGRYKTVNIVGAAVISAMVNAMGDRAFPFVFSGDGARFAVWPGARDAAQTALTQVQAWAMREFGIQLRAALVPVREIEAAGHRVLVARYQASEGVDYAMFSGGGLNWAEAGMKQGHYALPPAAADALPDLTGLSCRWSNVRPRNGKILSIVIEPGPDATTETFTAIARAVVRLGGQLDRDGHPVPPQGPGVAFPPPGLTLEAQVSHGRRSLLRRQLELLAQNFLIWVLFRTRIRLGNFDPDHYAATVSANADYRKFDDGLKMTLDAGPETKHSIEQVLAAAESDGIVRYGLFEQDEAMVTCFVPSPMRDDHIHFIDGAAGGYTQAAARIKSRG